MKRLRGYLMTAFSVGASCLMLIGMEPAIKDYIEAVGLTRVYADEADILTRDLSKTILERVRSSQRDSNNVKGRTGTLSGDGSSLSGTDDNAFEDVFVSEADAEDSGEPTEGTPEDCGPSVTYLGTWTATAYCSCVECTTDGNGITASGTVATEGRTIACNALPIGTEVLIDGHTYVVEDTGYTPYGDAWIDIFFASHDSALAFGVRPVDVYLIN